MKTQSVIGTTEFKIETFKRDIEIRDNQKRFIMMFKYQGSHWCFGLPIKSMYLGTIKQAKEDIATSMNDEQTRHIPCEYKIAEIIN
jgi:hypothetical protein